MQQTIQKPIEGKVAKILNSRELVINRGSDHGVEVGMKFRVVGKELILDPDSNEELGHLERETIRVKVVSIQPKFSIAQTYETYSGGSAFAEAIRLGTFLPITRVRTIQVSEYADSGKFDRSGVPVQVGDKLIQLENEYEQEISKSSSQ